MRNAGFEVACPPENHADATLGKSRLARSILAAQLARGSESKNETDKRQDKENDFISVWKEGHEKFSLGICNWSL
jgi:hypothetical protein